MLGSPARTERHVDDSAPAALNRATDVKWVWLPVPELAIVIVFGCASQPR